MGAGVVSHVLRSQGSRVGMVEGQDGPHRICMQGNHVKDLSETRNCSTKCLDLSGFSAKYQYMT